MKIWHFLAGAALVAAGLVPFSAGAHAVVGSAAPQFTATDSHGQTHTLSGYRGQYVVLEWHNQGCPYTRKQYVIGNMQALQKEWTARAWSGSRSSLGARQAGLCD